ncbi:hypothetical protein GQX74_003527 [Glossina fuscipes]|nr:hypothetical protein GQX74_003527 [Glossina fuscipes]
MVRDSSTLHRQVFGSNVQIDGYSEKRRALGLIRKKFGVSPTRHILYQSVWDRRKRSSRRILNSSSMRSYSDLSRKDK